ncbi:MAG: hypothetical protein C4306_02485 [Thermoleophilia bacterium]
MLGWPLVARVFPFRAVHYDEQRVGPLERVVAPPYDVIDEEARERYLARSPYNVVRLTLPESEAQAASLWRSWLEEGVLVREEEPALWWLAQEYVGPDGLARRREGLVCAVAVEPYSARVILPHERTHAGPKEGRLRLLRAVRAHLEPIFLLVRGRLEGPSGRPLLEVELEGTRNLVWRLDAPPPASLESATLLIADGHHRYETALAFHAEDGSPASALVLAVIVPSEQEGLTIFPTHRLARRLTQDLDGREVPSVEEGLASLPQGRAACVVYRGGRAWVVEGEAGELDTALVERLGPEGISYTPRLEEALAAVDGGAAEAAFLLRPPTLEQVWSVAERGQTMPQKSTYFYPKLPSGLLFLPL